MEKYIKYVLLVSVACSIGALNINASEGSSSDDKKKMSENLVCNRYNHKTGLFEAYTLPSGLSRGVSRDAYTILYGYKPSKFTDRQGKKIPLGWVAYRLNDNGKSSSSLGTLENLLRFRLQVSVYGQINEVMPTDSTQFDWTRNGINIKDPMRGIDDGMLCVCIPTGDVGDKQCESWKSLGEKGIRKWYGYRREEGMGNIEDGIETTGRVWITNKYWALLHVAYPLQARKESVVADPGNQKAVVAASASSSSSSSSSSTSTSTSSSSWSSWLPRLLASKHRE